MFKTRKKTSTPDADRVAELKDQRARLEDELAQNRVAIGRARLDDPDALDGLRETMDRLERELAELAAAMPEAEGRAAKERERIAEKERTAEVRRLERMDAAAKRLDDDFEHAVRALNDVFVRCRDAERPQARVDRHTVKPDFRLAVRVSFARNAPELAAALGGVRTENWNGALKGLEQFRQQVLRLATKPLLGTAG